MSNQRGPHLCKEEAEEEDAEAPDVAGPRVEAKVGHLWRHLQQHIAITTQNGADWCSAQVA